MSDMDKFEKLAKKHSGDRAALGVVVAAIHRATDAVYNEMMPGLQAAANKALASKTALAKAVEKNPENFIKPRTLTLYSIKFGLAKGKGRVEYKSDDAVITLIERHFPNRADDLITTKRSVDKSAVSKLKVQEAKKIGVTIGKTGDEAVVSVAKDKLDGFVKVLLKEHGQ
jgi:hypothetical protein